jgi:hypothetical protein
MARLQFPTVDEMTPEQRNVHHEVVSGIRGRLVGPLRAVIHSLTSLGAGPDWVSTCGFRPVCPKS